MGWIFEKPELSFDLGDFGKSWRNGVLGCNSSMFDLVQTKAQSIDSGVTVWVAKWIAELSR